MKLSVIVVNYNTCDMLRIALNSVIRAAVGINYEVFVVDNASADKSVEMLSGEFPDVKVIANTSNQGLAKAYNQGIKETTGEYVLVVSADTITGKKTFEKALEFMDTHLDAGGMGVRMITPDGRFLAESKHGFTESWAVFFKLTGLAKYFSKSRLTDVQRKDWVEEFQTSETDVLNGAFMLMRKEAIDKAGLFDERFHTYGYDIDLSYRIRLAGFKNYYFPKTYIINFNSRNNVKFSWDYLKEFYGAMIIFAAKYLFKVPEIKVEGLPQLFPSTYEVK
ncbi:glycosyltransferase family 2 protein [Mucilaginibacter ginsenosidivorax]|uniref:Glycosyltransferase family 2 protein n=1 Tax=Mucilaginibacter ginsenosidivorax TaxID=862126 RepID=A0A5B8W6C9_9SPHI|nr:glycosyltransferase family 2 protein [Mucilaginibacter ginsenosidivorax]QEC79363.1 glycosyltransferase family 2 protein [Mucilaginibacter ginsenosidivorax]